jgi:RHS repeat-associated protein
LDLVNRGPGGGVQSAYRYMLDAVGNRIQTAEERAPFDGLGANVVLTHTYEYDALDRLVRAATVDPASDTAYTFDAVGNRLSKAGTVLAPDPGVPELPVAPRPEAVHYTYNEANQLTGSSEPGAVTGLDYNPNGDRIQETEVLTDGTTLVTAYVYDREDRLIGVTKAVSDTAGITVTMVATYTYDGYGRRAVKEVTNPQSPISTTQVITYLYDGLDIIGAQLEENGVVTETYYYLAPSPVTGLRRPLEMERLANPATGFAGDRHWYQSDGLDSVVALTDEGGSLASPYLYDEYGQMLAGTTELQVFAYTGQDYDAETGLYHFHSRYYDPRSSIWLTQDVYRGDTHRYSYVRGSPLNSLDVLGFRSCELWNVECMVMYDVAGGACLWMFSQGYYLAGTLLAHYLEGNGESIWIDPGYLWGDNNLMSETYDKIWGDIRKDASEAVNDIAGGVTGFSYARGFSRKPAPTAAEGLGLNLWYGIGQFDLRGDYEIVVAYEFSENEHWASLDVAVAFNVVSCERNGKFCKESEFRLGNQYDYDSGPVFGQGYSIKDKLAMVAINAAAWLGEHGYATEFRMYSGWYEQLSWFVYEAWLELELPGTGSDICDDRVDDILGTPPKNRRIK